jgi:Nif-specific regulatory protein
MADADDACASPRAEPRQELLESQLAALFEVSSVLSRSLDLSATLHEVLEVLHQRGGMRKGMVSLVDRETGDLLVSALHENEVEPLRSVRYQPGEGVIGRILERNRPWIVECLADEPRFLDRLRLYDPKLPFIGVPIRIGEEGAVGVIAAQPPHLDDLIDRRARFLEMVANVIGQAVRLARMVEDERRGSSRRSATICAGRRAAIMVSTASSAAPTPCGSSSSRSARSQSGTPPSSSAASPAPARSWSPTPSTTTPRARAVPSSG